MTGKAFCWLAVAICGVELAAQQVEVVSFQQNGWLVASNLAPHATGMVEWASTPAGPWTNTWAGLQAVVADSNGVLAAAVPMFYRVSCRRPLPTDMVPIPGGSRSGTNPLGLDESYDPRFYPQSYSLAVTGFSMDKYEVSKAKWDEVRNWGLAHGYTDLPAGDGKAANHPVQAVSWYDCVKWCNARSQMEFRTPAYYTTPAKSTVYRTGQLGLGDDCVNWSSGYRLPTGTEWEYAARGGVASKRFPWGGNTISHSQANYYAANWSDYDLSNDGFSAAYATGGYPYTSPVGAFGGGKNAYGLYDMAGNVWEWCWEWSPGFEGTYRVLCGGSWGNDAYVCRVGNRDDDSPHGAYFSVGFRTVLP